MKFLLTLGTLFVLLRTSAQNERVIAIPTIYLNKYHGFPAITENEYSSMIDSTAIELSYWYIKNGLVPQSWDNLKYQIKPNQPFIFIKVPGIAHQDSVEVYSTITRRYAGDSWNSLKKGDADRYKHWHPYFDSLYYQNRKLPHWGGGDAYDLNRANAWYEDFDSRREIKETLHYLSVPCTFKSTPSGGKVYLVPSLTLEQAKILQTIIQLRDSDLSYPVLYKLIPNLNEYLIVNNTPIEELFLPEFEYQLIFELNNKFQKKEFTPQMGNPANNKINF